MSKLASERALVQYLMQLLAGLQTGRGLSKSPSALDLALGQAHRAVVGQNGG